jgi:hypothetical protein
LELCGVNPRGTRFQNQAASLNVSAESLYNALVADAEIAPPNFDLQGRQVDAWKQYRTSHLLPARSFSNFPTFSRPLTCGLPQERSWFFSRPRCIPGVGGTRRLITSQWSPQRLSVLKQYAFNDFTISQVAKLLGNDTDAEKVRIPSAEAFSRRIVICGAVCHESWILC